MPYQCHHYPTRIIIKTLSLASKDYLLATGGDVGEWERPRDVELNPVVVQGLFLPPSFLIVELTLSEMLRLLRRVFSLTDITNQNINATISCLSKDHYWHQKGLPVSHNRWRWKMEGWKW